MIPAIRPMQQSDIEQVYAIEIISHLAPWPCEILNDCVRVGYDCRVLELIKDSHKQIVGYIICRYSLNVCHILNLCVTPSEQGQGCGKMLLQALLDSLFHLKIDTVILEVRPSNTAAITLYKKFGFQQDLIKKAYYIDFAGKEDAIVLKKIIKKRACD